MRYQLLFVAQAGYRFALPLVALLLQKDHAMPCNTHMDVGHSVNALDICKSKTQTGTVSQDIVGTSAAN